LNKYRGLRIRVTQSPIASNLMQLTKEEQKVVDFDDRCQMVASHLWYGKSVTMTEQQLRWYGVKPHDVIVSLSTCLRFEEAEACWESERDGAYFGEGYHEARTYIVYCTKQADKYVFRAKVKA